MAAELLTDASRATDANNNPYSGAKWYFYATGTTTPQNVYADADLNTSLGAVVTADSGGKFVPIYFDSSLRYRGALKSGDGATTIYDIDPMNSGVMAQLGQDTGGELVGFKQIGAGATSRNTSSKLKDEPVSILDYVAEADKADLVSGTSSANSAISTLLSSASSEGRPARITKGSFKITSQLAIPEGVTLLLEDGANLFCEDNTLESILLVEADDVSIYGRGNAKITGPLTESSGRTGVCLLIRGTTGVTLQGFETYGGKYGIMSFDNDSLVANDVIVRNSFLWGWLIAGTRNSWFSGCGVDTTRGTGSAADGFKVTGYYHPSGVDWSTRSTYNLFFSDCWAKNTAAGQTFDIISANDAADDLHHIFISNPMGDNNFTGLLEMKCDETGGAFTNYPIHDIYVHGGSYAGNGSETNGIYIADRIYNVVIDGTVITDVEIGIATASPARYMQLKNITVVRPRKEGILWAASAGAGVHCAIIAPTIIDPNYGQGASTYAGINFTAGSNVLLANPTVRRSQVTSGSAHSYGIDIGASAIVIVTGDVTMSGHATAAVRNAGSATWPETITSPTIDIAASGSASLTNVVGAIQARFVACAYSLVYVEASNVARALTIQGRSTASSVSIASPNTSDTAVLYQRDKTMISPSVQVGATFGVLNTVVGAVTLPGSPTGQILVQVHGYYDRAGIS